MRRLFPLITALLGSGCQQAQSDPISQEPHFVATAVGRIDAEQEARHLVASVDGPIEKLFVSRGEQVAIGQPLLRVDCETRARQIDASLALARQATEAARKLRASERSAEIAAADAAVRLAQSGLTEQAQRLALAEKLQPNGFVSNREIEARKNSYSAANATLSEAFARRTMLNDQQRGPEIAEASAAAQAARAQGGVALASAQQCVLRSPIAGTVIQILRQEGEFSGASQGTPLLVVGNLERMIARAEINERDALSVRKGQKAVVWLDGHEARWTGRVSHLAGLMGRRSARSLDPTDRFDRDTREVFVDFDGAPPPALVGLRVTVGLLK